MTWKRADVVILTAIELEYAAVKLVEAGAVTGSRWVEEKSNGLPVALREFVDGGGRRLRIAVGRAPDMGKGSALTTLLPLVDALRPSCIAMCGVCAGRSGKTALGDVVVGERLYDYDAGKWTGVEFDADVRTYNLPAPWKIALEQFDPKMRFGGEDWWQRRPVPYEWQEAWVLAKLHLGVDDPKALRESKEHCPQWATVIKNLWAARDVKRDTRLLTRKGQKRAARVAIQYPTFPDLSPGGEFMPFQLHVQPIGSGSAVREDVDVWGFVTPHMRKTLALEMEASALAEIVRARAHHDPIEAVVMKGVMDFANHGRDDHFKHYAARASAECLIAFLQGNLAADIPEHDSRINSEKSGDAAGSAELLQRSSEAGAVPVSLSPARPPASARPLPTYANAAVKAVAERLEDARSRKQRLRDAGQPTDQLDREILELRRQHRQGGQLREGDYLGDSRYLLLKTVGRGGFAIVWEAYDCVEQQHVAIKVLHSNLAGDQLRRERFFRGAQLMMSLSHPAVVRVLEPTGEDEGFFYFVMEFVTGGNLSQAVLERRLEKENILPLILRVGEAVAKAHARGMVHRDIKPSNILLDGNGDAKLTDFDLVGAHDTTGGTRTGALGTVVYAAPECLDKPQEATARADVYGLGMTAIFCLLGRELSLATFRNPEPTIAKLDCSAAVREVLQRAVAWEPKQRFADASEMVAALEKSQLDKPELEGVALAKLAKLAELERALRESAEREQAARERAKQVAGEQRRAASIAYDGPSDRWLYRGVNEVMMTPAVI